MEYSVSIIAALSVIKYMSNKNKKIILFIDSLVAGGAQRQLVLLARVLTEHGYNIRVLTYRVEEQLLHELAENRIHRDVVLKKGKIDFSFFFRLYKYFSRQKPDVIISYLNTPNIWARLAGKLAGVKRIITSERNVDLHKSRLRMVIEKTLYHLSDEIIVNAWSTKNMLTAHGIPQDLISVIYNGVDTGYFSRRVDRECEEFRKSITVAENDVLILLPGRITVQKNHMALLQSFTKIADKFPTAKLLFVGNEFDKAIKISMQEHIYQHKLDSRIIFYGPSSDMPLVYSASDIVVLPSLWEGLPNVVIEAMSCTTPVVASNVSDNDRLIEDGCHGYVYNLEIESSLADKLESCLLKPKSELCSMGIAGRKKIEKLCSISVFTEKYLKLL